MTIYSLSAIRTLALDAQGLTSPNGTEKTSTLEDINHARLPVCSLEAATEIEPLGR
jgi:hypothetical protein